MRRLVILGQRTASLDGQVVTYTLKRSPGARYVRLEIREDNGLTVIVPRRYDLRHLDDVLGRRASWILSKLEMYSPGHRRNKPSFLLSGDSVPYLGRELCLKLTKGERDDGGICVAGDHLVIATSSDRADARLLEIWYRHEATRFIRQRADLLSSRMTLRCGRISIRGQKTRWASCSPRGSLSFNWRLMMAPEAVVDYVIIHELAHLREMNHTARFWRLVAEHCPTWRENRKWLNENGPELSARAVLLA